MTQPIPKAPTADEASLTQLRKNLRNLIDTARIVGEKIKLLEQKTK